MNGELSMNFFAIKTHFIKSNFESGLLQNLKK